MLHEFASLRDKTVGLLSVVNRHFHLIARHSLKITPSNYTFFANVYRGYGPFGNGWMATRRSACCAELKSVTVPVIGWKLCCYTHDLFELRVDITSFTDQPAPLLAAVERGRMKVSILTYRAMKNVIKGRPDIYLKYPLTSCKRICSTLVKLGREITFFELMLIGA